MGKIHDTNVGIGANPDGLIKGVKEASKSLGELETAAKKTNTALNSASKVDAPNTTAAKKAFTDLDKDIREVIANLYKLKAEGKKGVEISIKGDQLNKQIQKILDQSGLNKIA